MAKIIKVDINNHPDINLNISIKRQKQISIASSKKNNYNNTNLHPDIKTIDKRK